MTFADYLIDNFALLFLMIGTFILMGIKETNSDDKSRKFVRLTVLFMLILSIADYIELYYREMPNYHYQRVVLSVIGYSLRPLIALGYISILKLNKKSMIAITSFSVFNFIVYSTALFGSKIAFWYSPNNEFHRGPLGRTCYFICGIYILIMLIDSLIQIQKYKRKEGLIILISSIFCSAAMIISDSVPNVLNITIGISFIFFSMTLNVKNTLKYYEAVADNKAKTNFLFNMSHDLRTPMNAIIGFTDLAIKNSDDKEKQEQYLNNIKVSGKQLLNIIENVLEMTKLENNKIVINETLNDISEYKEVLYNLYENEIKKKNLTFNVNWNVQNTHIYYDKIYLEEIIENLLSNAIKYTQENGRVDFTVNQLPGNSDDSCITEFIIKDNGIGMSDEFLDHIYDSFTRERNTTASGVFGSGLGLGIVKNLIDLMNGTIEVNSAQSVGTSFTVHIPTKIGQVVATKKNEDDINFNKFINKRLLLAEDNDLNAEIAIELLQDFGFVIDRAEDGQICVNMLKNSENGKYSAILMDVQMPNCDGLKATQIIRRFNDESKSNIPIIAMTANAFDEDIENCLNAGMNAHVAKPVDVSVLVKALNTFIK